MLVLDIVDIWWDCSNPGFVDLLENPTQLIVVDANFYLPPDRQKVGAKYRYSFEEYLNAWIEPMHKNFPNIAIHEAVLAELVDAQAAQFAQNCIQANPPTLRLLRDSDLTKEEAAIRQTKEKIIAAYTKYDPCRDNKDDRGEVKSLAHMGAVGYLYFSTHDSNALRLVEEAEKLKTTLDEIQAIHFYEGIYYLTKNGNMDRVFARNLYRYDYYFTKREKLVNPSWEEFCTGMDKLYHL